MGARGPPADFPPTLDLSDLDGTNGFRLNGVAAFDRSGKAVSSAGDVKGDGIGDLIIGAYRAAGASYVVFGRNTAQNPFPASLNLSSLNGTNGFRLAGVAVGDYSGTAVSTAGDVNGDRLEDLVIGLYRAGSYSGARSVGRVSAPTHSPKSAPLSDSMCFPYLLAATPVSPSDEAPIANGWVKRSLPIASAERTAHRHRGETLGANRS